VKVLYRQTASDDIVRPLRYYLVTAEAPEIALRFREAVTRTIPSLRQKTSGGSAIFFQQSASSKSSIMAGCWI
jgi:hypothetical protein